GRALAVAHRMGGKIRVERPIGKTLYETAADLILYLRISPRGDRLAFLEYTGNRRAVVTLDSEGKSQTLSSNWLFASGLAWSPSGDEVWFSASETGWA